MCFFWQWVVITMKNVLLWSKQQTHFSFFKMCKRETLLGQSGLCFFFFFKCQRIAKTFHFLKKHSMFNQCVFLIFTLSLVVFHETKKLTHRVWTAHSISIVVTISSCTLPWSSEHWAHITGTVPTDGFSSETETERMAKWCRLPRSCLSSLCPPPSFLLVHTAEHWAYTMKCALHFHNQNLHYRRRSNLRSNIHALNMLSTYMTGKKCCWIRMTRQWPLLWYSTDADIKGQGGLVMPLLCTTCQINFQEFFVIGHEAMHASRACKS